MVPILSAGGVIAVPTDTVYGITCSVDSDEGIRKLYDIKQRNIKNPIAICVSDLEHMHKYVSCVSIAIMYLTLMYVPGLDWKQ